MSTCTISLGVAMVALLWWRCYGGQADQAVKSMRLMLKGFGIKYGQLLVYVWRTELLLGMTDYKWVKHTYQLKR